MNAKIAVFSFVLLIFLGLFIHEIKAESQTLTYTHRSPNLEFRIDAPSQVQAGQTFQVYIRVTNKAVSTIYLRYTRIIIRGNGISDDTINISQATDSGVPYSANAIIYENTRNYVLDKNKFSPYIVPLIFVDIVYNCHTNPTQPLANPDFGTLAFPITFVREKDWEGQYDTLKNDYDELKSKYETLQLDIGNARNLSYIFIIVTIVFIATTVYFAIRKPKPRP